MRRGLDVASQVSELPLGPFQAQGRGERQGDVWKDGEVLFTHKPALGFYRKPALPTDEPVSDSGGLWVCSRERKPLQGATAKKQTHKQKKKAQKVKES